MCFVTGLWRVICTEIGHLECPPPIAKGCKVDVRLLGWHHRRGRRQRSVYQIFKAVSPWRAGHSNAPAFWPQHVDRKASQFYCFSLVTKLCLTLGTPLQSSLSLRFPRQNTGVGCHFLLQGIFPAQGSNPCLLHWQVGSLPLGHQGSPPCDYGNYQKLDGKNEFLSRAYIPDIYEKDSKRQ